MEVFFWLGKQSASFCVVTFLRSLSLDLSLSRCFDSFFGGGLCKKEAKMNLELWSRTNEKVCN